MAFEIGFKASFLRTLKHLDRDLYDEAVEKIELLKDAGNHQSLKVHKLHGSLSDYWSFSVNYKIRIIFQYESKTSVVLLAIGDHDVYK